MKLKTRIKAWLCSLRKHSGIKVIEEERRTEVHRLTLWITPDMPVYYPHIEAIIEGKGVCQCCGAVVMGPFVQRRPSRR